MKENKQTDWTEGTLLRDTVLKRDVRFVRFAKPTRFCYPWLRKVAGAKLIVIEQLDGGRAHQHCNFEAGRFVAV